MGGPVIEFLGQVPLLQRLPSSSLKRIAELVQFKHYDHGDYVVRAGEAGDGIYFIWEGEAEVSGLVNADEGDRPELLLKKYDFFGYGTGGFLHQVNVVALSKLTCLVLQYGNSNLLQPKSIWNAEGTPEDFSLVEHILHLEPIEVDIFRGLTLPDSPSFGQVFGGQFIGQALAAASKTVDCLKHVHSLHAYFLVAGDNNLPIVYQVQRVRDGNSYATRRVDAKQRGVVVFSLVALFQKEEKGFEHQDALMPSVPPPERLASMEELRQQCLTDPCLPMAYRKTVAKQKFVPWPLEIRFCDSRSSREPSPPSMRYWFRARGKLSDDQALHRCVVAYASDMLFVSVILFPHQQKGLKTRTISLDHSIWFHRPVKANDWLLYMMESPSAYGGRGFVTGRMFDRKGELVASLTQEGLVRKLKPPGDVPRPKL